MTIGLRQLLLLAATVIFFVAIFINDGASWANWISIGLALFAGAALVRDMGWDRTLSTGGTRSGP